MHRKNQIEKVHSSILDDMLIKGKGDIVYISILTKGADDFLRVKGVVCVDEPTVNWQLTHKLQFPSAFTVVYMSFIDNFSMTGLQQNLL